MGARLHQTSSSLHDILCHASCGYGAAKGDPLGLEGNKRPGTSVTAEATRQARPATKPARLWLVAPATTAGAGSCTYTPGTCTSLSQQW